MVRTARRTPRALCALRAAAAGGAAAHVLRGGALLSLLLRSACACLSDTPSTARAPLALACRLLAFRLAEGPSGMRLMTDDERGELVTALKKKWDAVNSMYQQSSVLSLASLDTIGKVKRKEMYEAQLAQIEKDIEKLSKKSVYIADDQY